MSQRFRFYFRSVARHDDADDSDYWGMKFQQILSTLKFLGTF